MKKIILLSFMLSAASALAAESKVICETQGYHKKGDYARREQLENPINGLIKTAKNEGFTLVSAPSVAFTPNLERDTWTSSVVCVTVTKP